MLEFAVFASALRDALNQLHDPLYQPPHFLADALGGSGMNGESVQEFVRGGIESLRPTEDEPVGSRRQRIYDVLQLRYMQGVTQETTASRLDMTPRHLRREQSAAIEALARLLWEKRLQPFFEAASDVKRAQLHQDVEALYRHDPSTVSELDKVLAGVVTLISAVAERRSILVALHPIAPGLAIPLPAAQFRPLIVSLLTEMVRQVSGGGAVHIDAAPAPEQVNIIIAAGPVASAHAPEDSLAGELLRASGGRLDLQQVGDGLHLTLTFPLRRMYKIAVVEDNPDVIHTYQRYTRDTRYLIAPVEDFGRPIDEIERMTPDLVLLDVMLPGVDGWELLSRLKAHPRLHSTPVVICSVLEEEELALALGAARCLSKPLRYDKLIETLDALL